MTLNDGSRLWEESLRESMAGCEYRDQVSGLELLTCQVLEL